MEKSTSLNDDKRRDVSCRLQAQTGEKSLFAFFFLVRQAPIEMSRNVTRRGTRSRQVIKFP